MLQCLAPTKHPAALGLSGTAALLILAGIALLSPGRPAAAQEPAKAEEKPTTLVVQVSPDAEMQVEGVKTKLTGPVRRFKSPPLAAGFYRYTLKATWKEDGQEKSREIQVRVQAGETKEVDLRPDAAPPAPAAASPPMETPDKSVVKALDKPAPAPAKSEPKTEAAPPTPAPSKPKPKTEVATAPPAPQRPEQKTEAAPPTPAPLKPEPRSDPVPPPPAPPKAEPRPTVDAPPPAAPKPEPKPTLDVPPPAPPKAEPKPDAAPAAAPSVVVSLKPSATGLKLEMPGTLNLTPTGFHKLLPIKVTRDGLEGPVVVRFENVPAGVKIQGITIPADKTQADAEAWAADDADELEGELRVVGQADKARTEFPLKVKIKKR